MLLSDLLNLVDQKWWREFLSFVETGDASDEFLSFLDSDTSSQRAVEMALQIQGAGLERASKALRSDHVVSMRPSSESSVDSQSLKIAEALEAAVAIPAAERAEVVRQAVATARTAIRPDQAPALRAVVDDMEKELAGA